MSQFCCHVAHNRFDARNNVGEFLVAGGTPTQFWAGFNAAHRKDYSDTLIANKALSAACNAAGISNVKLNMQHVTYYCSHCGTKYIDFYSADGGALRDDRYVEE